MWMGKTFLRYYLKEYLKDEEKKIMHISGGWGNVLGRRMWENSRFTGELNKAPGSGRIPRRAVDGIAKGSRVWNMEDLAGHSSSFLAYSKCNGQWKPLKRFKQRHNGLYSHLNRLF